MQGTENPRREATGDRRQEIAAAARALIVEKGFEGLRTRDIAERVGINIATLHYHVPTKEALIELVVRSMRENFIDQTLRRPRENYAPLQRLRMEFEDFHESMTDNPELVVLFSELQGRARRDPRIDAVMRPLHQGWTGKVAAILAAGVADGTFRANLDPATGATFITGALGDFWRRNVTEIAALDALVLELERAVINPFAPTGATTLPPKGQS